MIRDINQFQKNRYDLLVIGGGINGAAIAHLGARRGLKVALLEKGDFAGGTSSKSTKLVHGGIRYLENFEFDLVSESLRERYIQLRAAPHLVKPLGFMIPVYRGDRRPLWMIRTGVFFYDLIAGRYKVQAHRYLNAKQVVELEPGLKKEGLLGGVFYYDAQMDDARLCLENVLSACEHGAHAANYAKVTSFIKENGKVVGAKARDLLSGANFEVRAARVILAVGPWANELLRVDDPSAKKKIRTTKGIHIVYQGKIADHALLIMSQSDKRIFFVIPWLGNSLIGTTDTDYIASPDRVEASAEDINYLLSAAKRVFPAIEFTKEKIITTFAGLRPLVRKGGSPHQVSRKHLFYETQSGVVLVVGGKYTTYRKIAEECLNKIKKSSEKAEFQVYGSGPILEQPEQAAKQYSLEPDAVRYLMDKYGSRYRNVLKLLDQDPKLRERISEHPPVIMAQLVYSVQTEMARRPEDIIMRRLSLHYLGKVSEKCLAAAERAIKDYAPVVA